MKTNVSFIVLFLLCLLSSHSNSKELQFNWKLENHGHLTLTGTATSSTSSEYSDGVRMRNYDDSDQLDSVDTGRDCDHYDVFSKTQIHFNQTNTSNNVPDFFYSLFGNGLNDLKHTVRTRYTLRGQTTTTTCSLSELLCCIFCKPCSVAYELHSHDLENQQERVRALQAATPSNFPEHRTIDRRIMTHRARTNNLQTLFLLSREALDDDTHIVELFLNTSQAQKWIIGQLNRSTNQRLKLIIPELSHEALPAVILVQGRNDRSHSESLQPSHFVSFIFTNGIKVQYHLNQVSDEDIQVLAIAVSAHGYTLTMVVNNYDVIAHQPPPHYSELVKTCDCDGACNCASSRENETDVSGYQSDTPSNYVLFGLEHSN
ncbi:MULTISPECIES: hypothetical protein [unclassified Endozoicomonas]|uniref:hypothetical protein n=1 Tax=unclassified Endozoicomonas TaxID=2644528 RepID=UPI0021488B2E|nr:MULTISPECIES: hypothetical protein [unclassified Endozoicomonas]